MSDFIKVPTTKDVYRAIWTAHPKLSVHASFSDPTGHFAGGSGEIGRMETGFGFRDADFPTLWIKTEWRIGPSGARQDEKTEYWLCVGKREEA